MSARCFLSFLLLTMTNLLAQGPEAWEELATFKNPAFTELSGLAPSLRREGVLWTHNDSGEPKLFALGLDGAQLGSVIIQGPRNTDWEDISCFDFQKRPYLLLADTGNNNKSRKILSIHVVEEPRADAQGRYGGTLRPAWSIRFRYPNGPRDCEAVGIDPLAKIIYLVSKSKTASEVYSLPLRPPPGGDLVAQLVTTLPVTANKTGGLLGMVKAGILGSQATALDFSLIGDQAAVLTYSDVRLYHRGAGESWKAAFSRQPRVIALPEAAFQAEALCFAPDGRSLFLTSEAQPAPLLALRLR